MPESKKRYIKTKENNKRLKEERKASQRALSKGENLMGTRQNYGNRGEERREDKNGCEKRMIKEDERADGKAEEKKRTTEECQHAGALCSIWVLSSK